MQPINALSLAPDGNDWLANTHQPRILHVFDQACNLINEHREVLSIVTPQIGDGPFNLVIEDNIVFSHLLDLQSDISIRGNKLHIGDLTINTESAKLWNPRPDWKNLHAKRNHISNLLLTNYQNSGLPLRGLRDTGFATSAQPYSTTASFSDALANNNISMAKPMTSELAGLGQGLTPPGDDFILGAILAAWIIHPPDVAKVLAEDITHIAAPLTTSLSAAYLKSAGKGEAGILWHNFFEALIPGDPFIIQLQMNKILSMGETSGADALAGFIGTFISYVETEIKHVIPKHF